MRTATARRWRAAGYVIPLCVVIGAALVWSSFATFNHAVGPRVPPEVAWAMPVALDGAVIVTTPVMLSVLLGPGVRTFAGLICAGALVGSMGINYAETGPIGVAPPLIAGLLIHLVGLVLRELRRIEAASVAPPRTEIEDVPSGLERVTPSEVSEAAEPEIVPAQPSFVKASDPVRLVPVASSAPQDLVFALLDAAADEGRELPSGPELTAAVREAGHEVNNEYGRTTRARWRKAREEGRVA